MKEKRTVSRKGILKALGPGLLMAGAAIGVSHLVQATRAGANYGYQLLIMVLLAHLFKYPFFEYGHRYAAATGQNLLEGYRRLGKAFLCIFWVLNLITAIVSTAGVTFVTAALAQNIGPLFETGDKALVIWSGLLMALCISILIIGRYKGLDLFIKIVIGVLFLATMGALIAALSHGPVAESGFKGTSPWSLTHLGFLIALMGWMPAPIELSVWQSLWIDGNRRRTGYKATWAETQWDFNIGYGITVVLAVAFLLLGALVMYGSGTTFSHSGATFAGQVIRLYTETIGHWSRPLIAIAAFTAMFSTTLTLIDAYPRSLAVGMQLLFPRFQKRRWVLYVVGMGAVCSLACAIITWARDNFKGLVDLATTIAFLAAPVFAYLNFRLIYSHHIPQSQQPKSGLRWLSRFGILYLIVFGLLFLIQHFVL